MNLSTIPILDHHAHPLLPPEATREKSGFQQWFSESTDAQVLAHHVGHTLFLRTAVRWLAELLACEPVLETVLAERAKQPDVDWTRRLFREANIGLILCDYGYQGDRALSPEAMSALLPCPVQPIMRLENVAESLISEQASFEQMVEAFTAVVSAARQQGNIALKSIIAYRSGLAVGAVPRSAAAAAYPALREEALRHGRVRLDDKLILDYLLGLALEIAEKQQLPLQIHTGFGDNDADLRSANPLLLRPMIEKTRAPIVLLHAGWPFYRETSHLASIYGHVWLDLSLAIPFATAGIPGMLRDVLGMAPFSKLLFATDAFTMPEIYWLAARWGRWGLGRVLEEFVADSFLAEQEAWRAAEAILWKNAQALYGLSFES